MCKRRAWTWLRAGFLPLVFSLAAALSLASCSWFTPGSGGTTSISPGVLVTGQGFVTLLDQQTGKQIWRRQTNVTDFMPLLSNDMVYIVSQNPGGYNPDRTDTLEALSLASGKLVWRWNWPEHWTPENAPTIIDGIVYLSESSLPANANYSPAPLSQYQGIDSFYENSSCEVHRSRGLPMTTTDIYVNERLDHWGSVAGVCQEIGLIF